MIISHDITTWTDWALDNLNYPFQPEWMSSTLNPANFQGYRGEYGGYFSGGRYSFEFITPEITYEMAYCPHLAIPVTEPVPDLGATGLMLFGALVLVGLMKRRD